MEQRESFGSYLKGHREKKGIRLEEIASITKIHLRNLEYLEAGQWKHLPPDPFLRGFIVAYAKYVGLDAKETVSLFLRETQPSESHGSAGHTDSTTETMESTTSTAAPVESRPTESPNTSELTPPPAELIDNPKTFPYKKVFIGVGAVAAVLVFVLITRIGQEATDPKPETPVAKQVTDPPADKPLEAAAPSVEETRPSASTASAPAIPPAEKPATSVSGTAPSTATATVETAAVPAPPSAEAPAHEVVIEGKERTWIKVVLDKEPAVEYFLPEGEKVTYKAKEKLKLVLGNSTGTKVSHNGQVVTGTKLQGTIRQYLFPADARFPQDSASRRAASSKVVDPAAAKTAPAPDAPAATESN